jgi:tetratricopeptide (TPR) repeat protein
MRYKRYEHPIFSGRFGVVVVVCALACGGCADPAPAPPQPRVVGLDDYTAGMAAMQSGDQTTARQLLARAVRENPDLITARQVLGDLYWKTNDYSHAAEQYEVFARLDPYNFKTHYDVALAYQFLNRMQDAIAAYLEALKLSPRDLKSNMNLGVVYLAMGRVDDAVRQLQLAVTIDPQSASAQCNLGAALESAGQTAKAEAAYQRAIELDPDMGVAMVNLGSMLLRESRGKEAAAVLAVAVTKQNTAVAHKRYGDALMLEHDDYTAFMEYDRALTLDQRYWPAMNQIGLIRLHSYQAGLTLNEDLRRAAVAMWRKSLALNPNQPIIRQWVDKWDQNGRVTP